MRAKEHWERTHSVGSASCQLQGEPWPFYIGSSKIGNKPFKAILYRCNGRPLEEYWKQKGQLGHGNATIIDWDAVGSAMKEVKQGRRTWITKHTSGYTGVSKWMYRWGKRSTDKCPRCAQVEDARHVWVCQGQEANKVWDNAIIALDQWFRDRSTQPDISKVLQERLNAWRYNRIFEAVSSTFPGVEQALRAQDLLGWDSLLEGRPTRHWSEVQGLYYRVLGSRRTGMLASSTHSKNVGYCVGPLGPPQRHTS